jgi:hypothetical protein
MPDIIPTLKMIDDALSGLDGSPDASPISRPRILIDKLSADVASGAATHLEPILSAIRDHGVEVCFLHLDEDVAVPDGIAVLDDDVSQEPDIRDTLRFRNI